jgi:hypothetical protein
MQRGCAAPAGLPASTQLLPDLVVHWRRVGRNPYGYWLGWQLRPLIETKGGSETDACNVQKNNSALARICVTTAPQNYSWNIDRENRRLGSACALSGERPHISSNVPRYLFFFSLCSWCCLAALAMVAGLGSFAIWPMLICGYHHRAAASLGHF